MNNSQLATEITKELPLNCIGGCGSGGGFFVILAIVGGATIMGITLGIIIRSFIDSQTN